MRLTLNLIELLTRNSVSVNKNTITFIRVVEEHLYFIGATVYEDAPLNQGRIRIDGSHLICSDRL